MYTLTFNRNTIDDLLKHREDGRQLYGAVAVPYGGTFTSGKQGNEITIPKLLCPYQVNDIIAIQEQWSRTANSYVYKTGDPSKDEGYVFRPATTMPLSAARMYARIVSIRTWPATENIVKNYMTLGSSSDSAAGAAKVIGYYDKGNELLSDIRRIHNKKARNKTYQQLFETAPDLVNKYVDYYLKVPQTYSLEFTNQFGDFQLTSDETIIAQAFSNYKVSNLYRYYEYDPTDVYYEGDTCKRTVSGKIKYYECITAIYTPEAWNPDHWVEIEPVYDRNPDHGGELIDTQDAGSSIPVEPTVNPDYRLPYAESAPSYENRGSIAIIASQGSPFLETASRTVHLYTDDPSIDIVYCTYQGAGYPSYYVMSTTQNAQFHQITYYRESLENNYTRTCSSSYSYGGRVYYYYTYNWSSEYSVKPSTLESSPMLALVQALNYYPPGPSRTYGGWSLIFSETPPDPNGNGYVMNPDGTYSMLFRSMALQYGEEIENFKYKKYVYLALTPDGKPIPEGARYETKIIDPTKQWFVWLISAYLCNEDGTIIGDWF